MSDKPEQPAQVEKKDKNVQDPPADTQSGWIPVTGKEQVSSSDSTVAITVTTIQRLIRRLKSL
jgi:hypothetical protein